MLFLSIILLRNGNTNVVLSRLMILKVSLVDKALLAQVTCVRPVLFMHEAYVIFPCILVVRDIIALGTFILDAFGMNTEKIRKMREF